MLPTNTRTTISSRVVRNADGVLTLAAVGYVPLREFFPDGKELKNSESHKGPEGTDPEKERTGEQRRANPSPGTKGPGEFTGTAVLHMETTEVRTDRIPVAKSATRGHFTQTSYDNEKRFRERNNLE